MKSRQLVVKNCDTHARMNRTLGAKLNSEQSRKETFKNQTECAMIQEVAVIPAVRVSSAEEAHFAAEAIAAAEYPSWKSL